MKDEALSKREQILTLLPRFLPGIAVVVITALLAIIYLGRGGSDEVDAARIEFAQVRSGSISPDVKGTGSLRSASEVWLTSPSGGFVERVLVNPGASVNQGDALLELVNKDLAKDFELSTLAVTEAQSRLSSSEYEVAINRLSAESALVQAQAAHETANREWTAYQELMKSNIASKLDVERARSEAVNSARLLENATRQLEIVGDIGSKRVSAIRNELSSRKALLKLVTDQIEGLRVRAPISGVVTALDVNLVATGQKVEQGQRLLRLVDPRKMLADIRVPSSRIAQVQVGASASVRVFGELYEGTVVELDPTVVDQHSRAVVELVEPLPASAGTGLQIEGRIKAGNAQAVLVADFPDAPQYESSTRSHVYRRSADGKTIDRVDVQIIGAEGKVVGFSGGIARGDEIVVRGLAPDESRDSLTLANSN